MREIKILTEEELKDYEKSFGFKGYIPNTPSKFDTKDMMCQRLVATVRDLKKCLDSVKRPRSSVE